MTRIKPENKSSRSGAAILAAIVMLTGLSSLNLARAESFFSQFKDDDGWFDASDWVLENAVGFMPVPIIITEPAVGAGLGMAAVFFHAPKNYSAAEFKSQEEAEAEFVLPDITAVAAGYTENDTWFIGGGHMAHWRNDTIRYEGLLGYASLNLKFYGLTDGTIFDDGLKFSGDALFLQQPLGFRLGKSDFFLGGEFEYSQVETKFDLGTGIPEIDDVTLDATLSALRVFMNYENLDTPFTPSRGVEAEIGIGRNDDAIGSDFDFTTIDGFVKAYWPVGQRFVIGARLEFDGVDGDVPFYAVPFIDLRGIPALRFQGENVLVGEIEARWAFHPRISAVGFLGLGKAADSFSNINDATSRVAQGFGIRYFMARKLGMHAGIDVAKGPEDTHYYLTIGSAW